jgi:ABC-type multidrug transport system fused ATPase/permease subunit
MIKYLPRVLRYLRPYARLVVFAVILMLVASAFSLLGPWPLKIIVDNILQGRPLPPQLQAILGGNGGDRVRLLIIVSAAGLFIALGENGLAVISNYIQTKIEQGMVLDVRSDLFQHAQRMSMAFHDSRRTGKLIFAINQQGSAVPGLLMSMLPLIQNIITLVGMFWIVYRIDPWLALISLSIIPLLYLSVGYYARRIMPQLRTVRGMEGESLSIVHEAFSMLRVIVAFGREDYEYRRFRRQGELAVNARVKVTVGETLFSVAVNMTTALGTALVLGFGTYRALKAQITVGELLVIVTYIASIYKPLEVISLTVRSLQEKTVGLETVFGMLDRESDIRDAPDAVAITRCRGDVELENVSFSYEDRKQTLEKISFKAKSGQFIGIAGQTGAGKTTLLSLIPRFYEPSSGRIMLDGRDIRQITLKSLREQISIVLQEPLLFSGSISENIRYGRLEASMEEIIAAAEAANAHDFIMRLPQKYETELGERGAKLSGGERQRISVARAFLKDAPVLVLDEPTSSVDSKTELVILEALERLMRGRTTFMIAHRLSTIRGADTIVVLSDGKLVQCGSYEALAAEPGLFRQLLDAQAGKSRAGTPAPAREESLA